ncbi:MAG: addiction module protein [Candidatus Hydrogenedentes bacterium]|nr:addiction module protein [Candidatus Hydrogenedentota bacterium]
MDRIAEAVLKEALGLPEQERAEIAGALLESLEPPLDPEIDWAWRDEVARRVAQFEAGEVKTIPWEQVRDRIWDQLSETRRP